MSNNKREREPRESKQKSQSVNNELKGLSKEKGKQSNINEQNIKIVEFVLYKFDLQVEKQEADVYVIQDEELVMELVNSFNGLYSYEECAKALQSNKEDISEAAAHLVDETDKDIHKTIVPVTSQTLLCQSELANADLNLKNFHKTKDIHTKENSLLYFTDLENLNYTMNSQ